MPPLNNKEETRANKASSPARDRISKINFFMMLHFVRTLGII